MNIEDKTSLMIPAYLRGELSAAEQQEIERLAAQNPQIAADIELQKNLKMALSKDRDAFEPGALDWARLSKAMNKPDIETSDTLHMADTLHKKETPQYWRYAAIMLAVITIGQAGVLGTQAFNSKQDDQSPQYVAVSEAPTGTLSAKFGFKSDAKASELTQALQSIEGTIINGPSSLGLYHIKFKSEAACLTAIDTLGNTPSLVSTVSACE